MLTLLPVNYRYCSGFEVFVDEMSLEKAEYRVNTNSEIPEGFQLDPPIYVIKGEVIAVQRVCERIDFNRGDKISKNYIRLFFDHPSYSNYGQMIVKITPDLRVYLIMNNFIEDGE